jgi:urease accessory protein
MGMRMEPKCPEALTPLPYALGFIVATALLHGLGIVIWMGGVARFTGIARLVGRIAGGGSALIGFVLAAGFT